MTIVGVLEAVTVVSASVFALWALYISLVEHPARMSIRASAALAEFRESYRRAAPWQVTTAALAFVVGLVTSFVTRDWVWALGGAATGAAIPFTLLVIMPTNHRLLNSTPPEGEITRLLARWGRLHWVRSLLGLAGVVILWSRLRIG